MKNKYVIEVSECYSSQIDDDDEVIYASADDIDGRILTMIDSDDIHSWIPVGSKEFVDKFNRLYRFSI